MVTREAGALIAPVTQNSLTPGFQMIKLFDDQEDVRTKLRVALRTHGSVLVYAPTGFGKTVLAAKLIELIYNAGKRVIFCVHRVDLIKQTAKTFEKVGIPFSYIASGRHYNPLHRVYIASIDTLKNRKHNIEADYVMVDEAHLSASAGWASVTLHYKGTGAKLIGLTGTPERLDGKPLGDLWDTMVMGPSVADLIEAGRLSRYRAFAPAGIDLTGVRTGKGDYVNSQIDEIMSGKAVLAGAVGHWRKYAGGKRTIAFAPSVARSEQLAAEFRASGINAVALDGNTPTNDRDRAFHAFADRQLDVIVNCQLFCEGFDLSAQVDRDVTIEAVLQYAPTKSLAKHLQQLGRALRRKDYPAVLLDLVGNIGRLGLPDDDREWSLEGRKKKKGNAGEVSPKICKNCFATFNPAPVCPVCGHQDEAQVRSHTEVEGELEEINVQELRRQKKIEQAKAGTLEELIALATDRGYKNPAHWASKIYTARLAKQKRRA